MTRHTIATILLCALLAGGCKRHHAGEEAFTTIYKPQYATCFEILGDDAGSRLIVTRSPWQGADSAAVTRLLILAPGEQPPAGYDGMTLRKPAKRVICMSSTHIAMLDAIDAADRVAGVSGINFISNPGIHKRRAELPDVGYEAGVDYEQVLAARPDVVLLYGVSGASVMEPKLRQLGIPYMYVSEYLEEDPLAKAEWMVAVGEVVGLRERAEERFALIPPRYEQVRAIAAKGVGRPKVMLNAPYGDQWVMAPPGSYMGRLLADAGADYLYEAPPAAGNRSVAVDLEEAYRMASEADVWLNTGMIATLAQLRSALPRFADVPALRRGDVWNPQLRTTPGGGNDYWESGVVNPDLVLRDLVKIMHPELMGEYPFIYYTRLP